MIAVRPTQPLFASVLCGTDSGPAGVAAGRQAAFLAGSGGTIERVPSRALVEADAFSLATGCRNHDLVVLGAEGNAQALIANAPIPILLARWCPAGRNVTDEILVVVREHAGAELAAELAAHLALCHDGSVTVMAAPGRTRDLSRAIAATQRIVVCTTGATTRVLGELAGPEVAVSRAAAQIGASLLVVAVGDEAWSPAEAADIARHAGCSLLAVPALVPVRSARVSSRSRRRGTPRRRDRSLYRSRGRSRTRKGRARRA